MMGLTRDQVLTRYLDETIHDLAEADYDDREVGYLQIMAALGTLDLGNQALREQVQQAEGLTLKHHLGFVIAGLRRGAPDMAWAYVEPWIASDDPTLWLAVASSYRFADWNSLQTREWEVLRHLASRGATSVDLEILDLSRQFAPRNPDLAIELLKMLAARADESVLGYVAMALTWPDKTPDGWAVEFANPQDYLDILHNFERLPSLDDHVLACLDRLGRTDPMQVIDFLEKRIGNTAERHARGDHYDAIPFECSDVFESIRSSPTLSP
jgi:hypothetical protein